MSFKSIFNVLALLVLYLCFPMAALSGESEICFNFYVVSKKSINESEVAVYEKQKKLVLNQLSRTQLVFDENKKRNCPQFKFTEGIVKKIQWEKALLLSQPLDFDKSNSLSNYYLMKTNQAADALDELTKVIKQQANIKYYLFLEYSPVRKIVYAENTLHKLLASSSSSENKKLELRIKEGIKIIKQKLNDFENGDSSTLIAKDRERVKQYEDVDQASALTWQKGEMTLWNDIEAQNTSIELKNLFKRYRSPENECLDVYVIPSAKSPSQDVKEVEENGKWTKRGGAALSSRLFPRTTNGKGNGIILTYNSRLTENRLAHELGHLLLDNNNAHRDKEEKDLMHADSKGGSYLSETECNRINENLNAFFTGKNKIIQ
jgi:hypothetical protein